MTETIILASNSPRRRELLGRFGVPFTVQAAGIDEIMYPCDSPTEAAARISQQKAEAIRNPNALIIAADTMVVLDGAILGKPRDERGAAEMLQRLSGRDHQVVTGVTVRKGDRVLTETETTNVWFRFLSTFERCDLKSAASTNRDAPRPRPQLSLVK